MLAGGVIGGVVGGIWPTLGIAAASTHGVLSALLFGLAVALTIAVLLWAAIYLRYRTSGVEIIDARNGVLTVKRSVMKMSRRAAYPWDQILAVVYEYTGWEVNGVATQGIYLKLAKRGRVRIAKRAEPKDLPWLASELNKFFEPVIGKRGRK